MGFITATDDGFDASKPVAPAMTVYPTPTPTAVVVPQQPTHQLVEFDLPALERYGIALFPPLRQWLIQLTCFPVRMEKVLLAYQSQVCTITDYELIFDSSAHLYAQTRVQLSRISNIKVHQDDPGRDAGVHLVDIYLPPVVGEVCLFRIIGPKNPEALRDFIYMKRDQVLHPPVHPVFMATAMPMPTAPSSEPDQIEKLNERIRQLEAQIGKN